MKTKHTKGRWLIRELTNTVSEVDFLMITDEDYPNGHWIADVKGSNVGPHSEERNANAKLIAAAPELLEALQFALYEFDQYEAAYGTAKCAAFIKMKEAIKKATE